MTFISVAVGPCKGLNKQIMEQTNNSQNKEMEIISEP
jgi:hypothetical protein